MYFVFLSRWITLTICATLFSSQYLFSQTTGNHSLETDSLALVDFYNALDGPNWGDMGEGWLVENIKDWKGVTLFNGRVSRLNMIGSNFNALGLRGHVPASIGNLDAMTIFWVSSSRILSMPDEFFSLKSLKTFFMGTPAFENPIPDTFEGLESLESFTLYGNEDMSGPLPSSLGLLPNLERLAMTDLALTSFSVENGQFSKLRSLYLYDVFNEVTLSQFNSSLKNLSSLKHLGIDQNDISAQIPLEIFQTSTLTELNLQGKGWTGSLSEDISQLENLTRLSIWSTSLIGNLPESLGELKKLQSLNLVHTDFEGVLPGNLEQLNELREIRIFDTRLSGTLRNVLDGSDQFYLIEISRNQFSGEVPGSIQNNTDLFSLDLSKNQLEGPVRINFAALDSLDFSDNRYCNLEENIASLCIEDTPDNRSISNDGFCGLTYCASAVNNTAETPSSDSKIDIFPNPASDFLTISTRGARIDRVQVFDILGRKRIESLDEDLSRIDISSLSAGQYVVQISTQNGSVAIKSVIVLE